MAGSFYYRPVDPGYGDIGAGIGRGLANIGAGIGERGQRKRIDEELGRRRAMEDARFDLELASMGGGRGEAPRQVSMGPGREHVLGSSGPTGSPLRDQEAWLNPPPTSGPTSRLMDPEAWMRAPEEVPEGGGGFMAPPRTADFGVAPQRFAGVPEISVGAEPGYRQLGGEAMPFYIEDPEARAGRMAGVETARKRGEKVWEADFEQGRAENEREERIRRMADSFRGRDPELSEEQALADARALVEGGARYGDLYPEETFTPREGRENFVLFGNRGTVQPTEEPTPLDAYSLGGSGRGVTPTSVYSQQARLAHGLLADLQWIDRQKMSYPDMTGAEVGAARERAFQRYGMDEAAARAIILRTGPMEGMQGEVGDEEVGMPSDMGAGEPERPGAAPFEGGEEEEEDDTAPLSTAEIGEMTNALTRFPRRSWRAKLEEAGFTPQQIQQVIGAK